MDPILQNRNRWPDGGSLIKRGPQGRFRAGRNRWSKLAAEPMYAVI